MHDLLSDPLLGARTAAGPARLSLPELLAALSDGKVEAYEGLRPHQEDPWHVFLVQLAASVQARHPTPTLPKDADYWREGLLDVAEGISSAWHLFVEDVTQPAFLQHPWRSWEADASDFRVKTSRGKTILDPKARRPDELDVLVTSRNHDVKMARVVADDEQAWIHALLLLQTTSGFLGQGNYGIVRMNGGFASRPIVAWARSTHPSIRFADEVGLLREMREKICRDFSYCDRGVVLTWLHPWNRDAHQYQLSDLEPWFVEATRPARLIRDGAGKLVALTATSKERQIEPNSLDNGDVGDPWTPINLRDRKKGQSALTLSRDGFSPQRVTDLIFAQGYRLTPLQAPRAGDGPGWFLASCLVRGQGTTEGYHRVEIPVPERARLSLFNKESRDTLARLAEGLLSDTKAAASALATALAILSEGGPEAPDFGRDAIKKWLETSRAEFSRQWEADFFPVLWQGADTPHEDIRSAWQQRLANEAQAILDRASMRLPLPSNRYWRATSQANSALRGVLRKGGLPAPNTSAPGIANLEETVA